MKKVPDAWAIAHPKFVEAALTGLLANAYFAEHAGIEPDKIAHDAIAYADAIVAALSEDGPPQA